MGEYLSEILSVVKEKFPGYLLVTEEVAGGNSSPCLLVQKAGSTLKRELDRRYRREDRFSVTLFLGEKDLLRAEAEGSILAEALCLLPSGQRAEEVQADYRSDRVTLQLSYGGILFKTDDPAKEMAGSKLELAVKGGDYGRRNI